MASEETLQERLRLRANIRRRIRSENDRIADVCDEAAAQIDFLETQITRVRVAVAHGKSHLELLQILDS